MPNSNFKKNITWIFVGNILHAILQFLINIIAARQLAESDYGLINYAISLVALFSAVGSLGFSGVISKKFAENEDNSNTYIWTAILSRSVLAIPIIVIIGIIARVYKLGDVKSVNIIIWQSFTILFSSGDILIYWFRYKYQASIATIARFIAFILMAIWRLYAIFKLKNATAYNVGSVLESLILSFLLILVYRKSSNTKITFNMYYLKDLLVISYPFITSAILATIYAQTDKIMLGSMIGNEAVAYYAVAMTIAGAISIIPSTLIEGYRTEIFLQKEKNYITYKKRLSELYCIIFWLCILYCIIITIFSKNIIYLIYGDKYIKASISLPIIVWYTSFSYFGGINNLYLIAEKKTKWVQIITFAGAIINIILNAILIPRYGIRGAAIASLITQIIANFIFPIIIKELRNMFKIIIYGILFFNYFKKNRN